MINTGIFASRHRPSVHPQYQKVLDRATLLGYAHPTASEQVIGNQLMIDFYALGVLGNVDPTIGFTTLQVYSRSNADFGRIDWVDTDNVYVAENSPTYNSVTGFQFDTTNYLRSNNFKMTMDPAVLKVYGGGWNASGYQYDGVNRYLMGIQDNTVSPLMIQVIRENNSLTTLTTLGNIQQTVALNYLQDNVNYSVTSITLNSASTIFANGVAGESSSNNPIVTPLAVPREWAFGGVNRQGFTGSVNGSLCSLKYGYLGTNLAGFEAGVSAAFQTFLSA